MTKLLSKAWMIWFVAALFYSYEFFLRISPTVMVPELMHSFRVNAETLGLLSGFYYYAYAIMQVPAGILLDRFGIRRLLVLAALCVSLGTLCFSLTHQLWIAELGRVITGVGSAFSFIGALKLVRNWFDHRLLAIVIGLTNTVGVMGAMFGELPLAIFVDHAGWRETLFIASGVGALLTVLLFIVIKDKPESISLAEEKINPSSYSLFKSIAIVLSNPSTWLVALLAALIVGPIAAFAELWSVPFFTQVHHVSRTHASFLSMFVFLGIAVGGPTHGWLSGRMASRMPIIRLGALGALLTLSLIIFLPLNTEILFIPLLFLFGFFSATMLLCFAMNSENNPIWTAGLVVGFTNMFIMGGASLFQPLVGHVLDVLSHNTARHLITAFTAKEYHIALSMLLGCQVMAFLLTYIIKDQNNESV